MLVYFLVILFLLLIDYILVKKLKKTINNWYKDSVALLEKLYPLSLAEKKQSKYSYIMRILVLSCFWLSIFLFGMLFVEFKSRYYYSESYKYAIDFEKYYYTIFIILGYFVYFFLNVYSKTNIYVRTFDIILSTFTTILVIFLS